MVLLQQAVVDAYINSERLFVMKRTVIGVALLFVGAFVDVMCILATAIATTEVQDFWYILMSTLNLWFPFYIGAFLFLVGLITTLQEYFRKQ